MTNVQTSEILDVLRALPMDKVDEVKDFALFLRDRYRTDGLLDESDEWSDDDMHDVSVASISYAFGDDDAK